MLFSEKEKEFLSNVEEDNFILEMYSRKMVYDYADDESKVLAAGMVYLSIIKTINYFLIGFFSFLLYTDVCNIYNVNGTYGAYAAILGMFLYFLYSVSIMRGFSMWEAIQKNKRNLLIIGSAYILYRVVTQIIVPVIG